MTKTSDSRWSLHLFLKIYQEQIRFFFKFMLLFLLLNFVYSLFAETFIQDFIFSSLTARPAAAIIHFISSGREVGVSGSLLVSQYVSLEITHGCEGSQSILIITSAILAYGTRAVRKVTGILGAVSFLYLVNLFRIVGVYYVVKYYRGALDVAHLFVGQTFVIVMMFVFFVLWIRREVDEQERTD